MNLTFTELQSFCKERIDHTLQYYLKNHSSPATRLHEAMVYAALNGGKRLRSFITYTTGYALGASWEALDAPASAIELIHSYSLIHDDLPAMDNSDLRRGQPTCHKVYGEAIAILAGDALQTLAFEILANPANEKLNTDQRLAMIKALSKASGLHGIAGGQTLDMLGCKDLAEITSMYQLKTGILLLACVRLAHIAADLKDQEIILGIENFARCIGLAYQIQDDLLDLESDTASLGKPQRIDILNQKKTYVTLAGINPSKAKITQLFEEAKDSIKDFKNNEILLALANYILHRRM